MTRRRGNQYDFFSRTLSMFYEKCSIKINHMYSFRNRNVMNSINIMSNRNHICHFHVFSTAKEDIKQMRRKQSLKVRMQCNIRRMRNRGTYLRSQKCDTRSQKWTWHESVQNIPCSRRAQSPLKNMAYSITQEKFRANPFTTYHTRFHLIAIMPFPFRLTQTSCLESENSQISITFAVRNSYRMLSGKHP